MATETQENKPETYACLQNDTGKIEVDLVTYREKGQQVRYLSLNVQQIHQEGTTSSTICLDEEAFNKIKIFFKQLEWNS